MYINRAIEETVKMIFMPVFSAALCRDCMRMSIWIGKPTTALMHFLNPVQDPEKFGAVNELKTDIGQGSVICMATDFLPIDEKTGLCRCG